MSQGAVKTWNAGINNTWDTTTTANWTGATWANDDDAVFGAAGAGIVNVVGGGVIANKATFNAAGYTINGGPITFTSGSDPEIAANENATINSNITLSGAQTWSVAASKTLTLGGNINAAAANTDFGLGGNGSYLVNGSIGSNVRTVTFNGAAGITTSATFTTANTFTGNLHIGQFGASATVNFSAVNQLGSGAGTNYIAIQNGSTLNYTGAGAETISGRQIWWNVGAANVKVTNASANLTFDLGTAGATRNQQLTKLGAGTLTFTNGTATGVVIVREGTLKMTGSGPLGAGPIYVGFDNGENGTLTIDTTATLALSQLVAGQNPGSRGTVNLDGGTLNFSSFFDIGNAGTTLTSNFNQTAGTVNVNGFTYIGNSGQGSFDISGGTYNAKGGVGMNQAAGATGTSSLAISNTGEFIQTGGNFVMSQVGGNSTFTQTGGKFSFTGLATNFVDIGNAGTATATVSGGTFTVNTSKLFVGHSGAGTLTLSGTGEITAPLLDFGFDGNSTNSGVVNLDGGTLKIGGVRKQGTGAGFTATFNFNGGTLQATATNPSFMTGLTAAYVKDGGAKINTIGFDITIAQPLLHFAGATTDGLTKSGAGKLTLTDNNTYTGTTTVDSGGTLALSHASNNNIASSSAIIVNGTLDVSGLISSRLDVQAGQTLGGTGSVSGAVNVVSGGKLAPGNNLGPGDLDTGNLQLSSGSTFEVHIDGLALYDQVDVNGTVNVTGSLLDIILGYNPVVGSTFTLIENDSNDPVTGIFSGRPEGSRFFMGGQEWVISYLGGTDNNDVVLTAAPEPSTLVLFSVGLVALVIFAWRERRHFRRAIAVAATTNNVANRLCTRD